MYSPRIERALIRTLEAHGLQLRKAGEGFEASHVISVGMIVHDFGFSEDTIVAAILHDTLEDTSIDRDSIREEFGEDVLAIVEDVTEPPKSQPWTQRKAAYVEQLRRTTRDEARAVASADKIHNLARMIEGARGGDADYWGRFSATPDAIKRYQLEVLQTLRAAWSHPILDHHEHVLREFLGVLGGSERSRFRVQGSGFRVQPHSRRRRSSG